MFDGNPSKGWSEVMHPKLADVNKLYAPLSPNQDLTYLSGRVCKTIQGKLTLLGGRFSSFLDANRNTHVIYHSVNLSYLSKPLRIRHFPPCQSDSYSTGVSLIDAKVTDRLAKTCQMYSLSCL